MKCSYFAAVALLTVTVAVAGCKKQEQCASGDTPGKSGKAVAGVHCVGHWRSTLPGRRKRRDPKLQKSLLLHTTVQPMALTRDSSKASERVAPNYRNNNPSLVISAEEIRHEALSSNRHIAIFAGATGCFTRSSGSGVVYDPYTVGPRRCADRERTRSPLPTKFSRGAGPTDIHKQQPRCHNGFCQPTTLQTSNHSSCTR